MLYFSCHYINLRLICDKFPCTPEYVEQEISKDAPRTLIIAIDIEDMNGKLVHEA